MLVAGYKVDGGVAQGLKNSTGGSEYVFVSQGRVVTSTLSRDATAAILPELLKNGAAPEMSDYLALPSPLLDISGAPVGQLFILRSFARSPATLGRCFAARSSRFGCSRW